MSAAYHTPHPAPDLRHPPLLRLLNRRILVVEDDVDLSNVVLRIARSIDSDLVVDWVTDVESARAHLMRRHYDVVLADYMLDSSYTGLALRSHCQKLQPQARFALMSALPIRVPAARDCPFLRKPFTLDECRGFLDWLLND